jgi:hypothetical protein
MAHADPRAMLRARVRLLRAVCRIGGAPARAVNEAQNATGCVLEQSMYSDIGRRSSTEL